MRENEIFDLTIGAWLLSDGEAVQVGNIDFTNDKVTAFRGVDKIEGTMKGFSPVRLTTNILCGGTDFCCNQDESYFYLYDMENSMTLCRLMKTGKKEDDCDVYMAYVDNDKCGRSARGYVKYLHELQQMLTYCQIHSVDFSRIG